MAKLVRPEHFVNRCEVSSELSAQTENIQHYVDMGFDEIYLHNVGRNQARVHRSLPARGPAQPPPRLTRS